VSKNLIHDAAETPNPIKTRELTDEETLRVINELGHSSKTSHSTSIHRGNGYWSQKVQLVGLPSMEDINLVTRSSRLVVATRSRTS